MSYKNNYWIQKLLKLVCICNYDCSFLFVAHLGSQSDSRICFILPTQVTSHIIIILLNSEVIRGCEGSRWCSFALFLVRCGFAESFILTCGIAVFQVLGRGKRWRNVSLVLHFYKFHLDSPLPFVLSSQANASRVLLILFDPICLSHSFQFMSDMFFVLSVFKRWLRWLLYLRDACHNNNNWKWNTKWALPRKLHIFTHEDNVLPSHVKRSPSLWLHNKSHLVYLTRWLRSLVRYRVDHSKIKFISKCGM